MHILFYDYVNIWELSYKSQFNLNFFSINLSLFRLILNCPFKPIRPRIQKCVPNDDCLNCMLEEAKLPSQKSVQLTVSALIHPYAIDHGKWAKRMFQSFVIKAGWETIMGNPVFMYYLHVFEFIGNIRFQPVLMIQNSPSSLSPHLYPLLSLSLSPLLSLSHTHFRTSSPSTVPLTSKLL